MRILTAEEVRELDRVAIEELGVPGMLLMEHAASAVAEAVLRHAVESKERGAALVEAIVVAGGGNNGGDGYAAARLLLAAGIPTRLLAVLPPSSLAGDAAANAEILRRFGGLIEDFDPKALAAAGPCHVIVDALLGTGLSRRPEGSFEAAILAMNDASSRGATVIAVDLPSGLDADSGSGPGAVVRADRTVTFGALKPGLVIEPGASLAGEVEVAPISWPPAAEERFEPALRLLQEGSIRSLLHSRPSDSHKGSFGHCLVLAGSEGKSGAAALAARGALRGGAGLVSVVTRRGVVPEVLRHAMEVMAIPLAGDGPLSLVDLDPLIEAAKGKGAVLMGPGIPRGNETGALLGRLLASLEPGCPAVLDADALNALEGQTSLLTEAAAPVVITPHPGEMARLMGTTISEIQADRLGAARSFAKAHRCTVVLKGAGTVVADPDGEAAICPTGNPGMSTAGSGDVLGGLLTALLAQGLGPAAAARAAVYVHGLAGDLQAARRGQAGLVASDLLEGITEVWQRWEL